jgi:TetR/AcrR family transcriptional repressor of lmrAB and yxaGH operons
MASEARQRMIESTVLLLAQRGLQATSFSEVLERSGAPRGSLYHYFPQGKDQLVDSALDLTETRLHGLLDAMVGSSAEAVTEFFLGIWRAVLTRSNFQAGCAVVAVTVATESPDLLAHTAAIFRAWRARLAVLLEAGGLSPGDASRFAATLVASSEGAVILSRAEQGLEPFDLVAEQLLATVRSFVIANG